MKVEFHRTGGIAGPAGNKHAVLDLSSLSPDETLELKRLVESADQASQNIPDSSRSSLLRDAFHYSVTVDFGERRLILGGPMVEIPETARPLINWLEKHAG